MSQVPLRQGRIAIAMGKSMRFVDMGDIYAKPNSVAWEFKKTSHTQKQMYVLQSHMQSTMRTLSSDWLQPFSETFVRLVASMRGLLSVKRPTIRG